MIIELFFHASDNYGESMAKILVKSKTSLHGFFLKDGKNNFFSVNLDK